jgi:hypothetical protein
MDALRKILHKKGCRPNNSLQPSVIDPLIIKRNIGASEFTNNDERKHIVSIPL